MRRAMVAIAACGAMLGLAAPTSSAAVHRVVDVCQGTATWQVTIDPDPGESSAVRTLDAGQEGCRAVHAELKDDGNFSIRSEDAGGTVTHDHPMEGAFVTGVPAFVGVLNSSNPGGRGPIVIVGDSLAASLTYVDTSPTVTTEVHTPDGRCGAGCYKTKVVFARAYAL